MTKDDSLGRGGDVMPKRYCSTEEEFQAQKLHIREMLKAKGLNAVVEKLFDVPGYPEHFDDAVALAEVLWHQGFQEGKNER